jgi:acetyl esterase
MNLPEPLHSTPAPSATLPSDPDELRAALRAILRGKGPIIDPPGMKALYAPLLADALEQGKEAAEKLKFGVQCERDLAYGSHARHRLDIYRPVHSSEPPDEANKPVAVFIHGGGFMRGDKSERAHVGPALARQGWLTVVPNYRLAPECTWPAGAQDVASVCQWLRQQWPKLTQRPLLLIGESAGAAHVATATLCKRFCATQGWARFGAVLISGTYNPTLENQAARQLGVMLPDVRNQAYFGADPTTWAAQSLVDQIDAAPFPLLISYAELDPLQFQVGAGELFAKLVRQHRFAPELQLVRGHNHLSQIYALGTADDALLEPLGLFAEQLCKV